MVTTYADYRDFGGVKFPTRIRQSHGRPPGARPAGERGPAERAGSTSQVPDAVRNATERVTADKVADGVWYIAGGSHNSVAIEMKDHLVLVEAPLNDGRTQAGDRRR